MGGWGGWGGGGGSGGTAKLQWLPRFQAQAPHRQRQAGQAGSWPHLQIEGSAATARPGAAPAAAAAAATGPPETAAARRAFRRLRGACDCMPSDGPRGWKKPALKTESRGSGSRAFGRQSWSAIAQTDLQKEADQKRESKRGGRSRSTPRSICAVTRLKPFQRAPALLPGSTCSFGEPWVCSRSAPALATCLHSA